MPFVTPLVRFVKSSRILHFPPRMKEPATYRNCSIGVEPFQYWEGDYLQFSILCRLVVLKDESQLGLCEEKS